MTGIILKDKLKLTKQTFDELTELLTDPNLDVNSSQLLEICKTINSLADILKLDRQLKQAKVELASVRQIVADPAEDLELKELATVEIVELETRISRLTKQLNILLLPQDPLDEKSVFLEIIADPNQKKSSIWASNLLRMYALYGESQNWRVLLTSETLDELGELKQAILAIEGDGVYSKLKLEMGIHQLESNSQGTKTDPASVTVIVIPQVDSTEMPIAPQEIKIYDRRSTNCRCNLCVCKTEFGVQILHQSTGIRITCTEERSQLQNRERAMQILRAKLYEMKLVEQQQEVRGMRRSQVGTGARSEKIRTYNYKDNRITDHRLGQNFPLANSLEGDIDNTIESCISQDRQERLEELANSPDTAEALN